MYLTLDQITLVQDKSKAKSDDAPVYERELNGDRIFTTDTTPSQHASKAKRYGVIYFDIGDRPCIIPDAWNDDDACRAKERIDARN